MSTTMKGSANVLRWILAVFLSLSVLSLSNSPVTAQKDPERKVLYRLEYIDIEKVLDNNRMLTAFIRCFMRQGPCTPEARDFRKLLPKLAVSMCADCTPRQRFIIKKVFGHLMEHRPKEWEQLLDRFDPQRKYAERLSTFMSDYPMTTSESPFSESSSLKPEFPTRTELPPVLIRSELPIPSKSKSLKKVESQSKYDAYKSAEILNESRRSQEQASSTQATRSDSS